jgi:hypothetical protein
MEPFAPSYYKEASVESKRISSSVRRNDFYPLWFHGGMIFAGGKIDSYKTKVDVPPCGIRAPLLHDGVALTTARPGRLLRGAAAS